MSKTIHHLPQQSWSSNSRNSPLSIVCADWKAGRHTSLYSASLPLPTPPPSPAVSAPRALEPAWPCLSSSLPCSPALVHTAIRFCLDWCSGLPPGFPASLLAPLPPFSPHCSQSHRLKWKLDHVTYHLPLFHAPNLPCFLLKKKGQNPQHSPRPGVV